MNKRWPVPVNGSNYSHNPGPSLKAINIPLIRGVGHSGKPPAMIDTSGVSPIVGNNL